MEHGEAGNQAGMRDERMVDHEFVIKEAPRCEKCGYILFGLETAGRCPECGTGYVITRPAYKCRYCGNLLFGLKGVGYCPVCGEMCGPDRRQPPSRIWFGREDLDLFNTVSWTVVGVLLVAIWVFAVGQIVGGNVCAGFAIVPLVLVPWAALGAICRGVYELEWGKALFWGAIVLVAVPVVCFLGVMLLAFIAGC